ncbi:response regulator [Clostridiales bacterium COT073_COT-073]|nr:response regulator [Clostridiales bacterium COT073_COT-073]
MEKIKIVIVEDEYYVRKGIIESFPWEEIGCAIIGEAANGRAAIEVIERTRPDLVIADIEMPIMDGVEMVRMLKSKNIQTEYIFLTAHQKFTYVHSALKLDVADYLLKPFQYQELKESIEKVRLKLSPENMDQETAFYEDKISTRNNYVKEAITYVREHYADEISNITVAEHLNINSMYFCRLFKKETGYTFGQYVINYRIHVAAGLLSNFDLRVSEVAEQVGIMDSNYFSQIFKKIMGMTPREYQKEKLFR